MATAWSHSTARIRRVKKLQFGVLSPDETVSSLWCSCVDRALEQSLVACKLRSIGAMPADGAAAAVCVLCSLSTLCIWYQLVQLVHVMFDQANADRIIAVTLCVLAAASNVSDAEGHNQQQGCARGSDTV
jgi:hypothetical protein